MNTQTCVITFLVVTILTLGFLASVKAQEPQGSMQSFYDSTVFGIRIQANATAEVQPGDNITVTVMLTGETQVDVANFNLSIFGFLNDTDEVLMANISDSGFSLNNTSRLYGLPPFLVPQWVSGRIYGEITLANSAEYGPVTVNNDGLVCYFPMTNVENVYFEGLEGMVSNLTQEYQNLNQNYTQLEQKYQNLDQNYIDLEQKLNATVQGNANDLDNTRTVAAVLGVTTVVFVATTMYLILRRSKQYL